MNSNNRIAATLYSLGTQFVSGILSINTPHKGDDDGYNFNQLHYRHQNKCMFVVNCVLLYVSMKSWCAFPAMATIPEYTRAK